VAPSMSRAKLFDALGLSEDGEKDRRLYSRTKQDEAVAGRKRTSQNAESLAVQYRNDASIQVPY
ncbi:hypothetical protein BJ546DRAFT_838955, partial [Cryomyces antarcticus]